MKNVVLVAFSLLIALPLWSRANNSDAVVTFNEVMYHPLTNEAAMEWVELYNQLSVDVDVSGWRLDNGISYVFPQGTLIHGRGYLVIAANPAALSASTGLNGLLGPFSNRLSNAGETVELRNNSRRLMDSLSYKAEFDWPVAADGAGPSLAKIDPTAPSSPAGSWTASEQSGGTPGAPNFTPLGAFTFPPGLVSYWNFDETNGTAVDLVGGNHGTLGAAVTRVAGLAGSGALAFDSTTNAFVNLGAGIANNFSVSNGITIETLLKPNWSGAGAADIFHKEEPSLGALVSYWSFNEAASGVAAALDPISGNNGSFLGTATRTNGLAGLGAALFNNSAGDGVNVGPGVNNSFSMSTGITVFARIRPHWSGSSGDYDEVFRKEDGGNRILFSFQNDGNYGAANPPVGPGPALSFGLNVNGVYSELDLPLDGSAGRPTLAQLTDGATHSVAASYDAATGQKAIYIDGALLWSVVLSGNTSTGGGAAAVIGNASIGGGEAFTGAIDEVAIWRAALTSDQVASLAAGATPLSVGASADPAANRRILLAFQNDTNYANANPPVGPGPVLSFGLNVGGIYSELDLPLDGAAGRPTLAQLEDGNTHHLAATYDRASGLKGIYIDGALRFSNTLAGAVNSGGSGPAIIGNAAVGGTEPFNGTLDEVGFWNGALTSAEINRHFMAAEMGQDYFGNVTTERPKLAFNELAGSTNSEFWLELINYGAKDLDLGGFVIAHFAATNREYLFPPQMLAAGAFLPVTKAMLGFGAGSGDKLVLYMPDHATVLDAVVAKKEARGRHPDGVGRWLFPSAPTPGASNLFVFHDEIVINEVMYHHSGVPGTPAAYGPTNELLSITNVWSYQAQGLDLGTAWRAPDYDDSAWLAGAALLHNSPSTFPVPKNTLLPATNSAGQLIITYYFRAPFVFTGNPNGVSLSLVSIIDDGAVYYLNGVEVYRQNMPAGPILYGTVASVGVGVATFTGPFAIAATNLLAGANLFAVEVHRISTVDRDMVFGAQLLAAQQLAPATPFRDSPESWVELFNRGSVAVDLTGWRLDGGIHYPFAAGRMLAPGAYLVVPNDVAYMQSFYPGIDLVGPFTGTLSFGNDSILLMDPNNNPANQVQYFGGGHWPAYAHGGGSSLELRDPWADNSKGEAWAASIESAKSAWTNITYLAVANSTASQPSQWNEFVIGLLDSGECLIDDLSVIESPTNSPVQLIQNGSFETGATGWRFLGDHRHSEIIVDPDNPGNHVLHLVASGVMEHMHNHLETTLAGNHAVVNGRVYQVSFRVKWLAGDRQLNTRLYFNRVTQTTLLPVPALNGTPGAPNSRYATNIGPTFANFGHSRVVPLPGEPVTVTVQARDPQGVSTVSVWWSVNSGAWSTALMSVQGDGPFTGTIPGYPAGSIVQFYVRAVDGLGAVSTYPAAGPASHALYVVNDGQALLNLAHNFRIVMTPADTALLFALTNVMSNETLGATVIWDEERAYYGASVRLKGSERGRDQPQRVSFHVQFSPDELFRGAQPVMLVDRSGGWRYGTTFGQDEILINHLINRAGGIPGNYYDLIHEIGPRSAQTGSALFFPRLEDNFLDTQFDHGHDGELYELELIYYPLTTDNGAPQGYKLPEPDNVLAVDLSDLGNDKEQYRYNFITKINRDHDDYSGLMAFAKSFSFTGGAFDTATQQTMDVNQWMRAFAMMSLCGAGDTYTQGNNHNLILFVRPGDQKVMAFPYDWDFSFVQPINAALHGDQNLAKVIDLPANQRLFYSHLLDLMSTVYNSAYMAYWVDHYNRFVPGQNFSAPGANGLPPILSYIAQRESFVMSQLPTNAPFAITSNGGNNFGTSNSTVTLTGTAPLNVQTIEVNGISYPITWTSVTNWTLTAPLFSGVNLLAVQGVDSAGTRRTNFFDTITVTNSGPGALLPVVINEWMADNAGPGGFADPLDGHFQDWFELFNPNTSAFNLSGYFLTDTLSEPMKWGIPAGTVIGPGGFLLVWADNETNQNGLSASGDLHAPFQLSSSGEAIGLFTPAGVVQHAVVFGPQIQNVSQGLFPDGNTNTIYSMSNWTPRAPNHLGPPPSPHSTSIAIGPGGTVSLFFSAVPGRTYRVEFKDNLSAPVWTPVGPDLPAAGPTVSASDNAGATPQRFYRVLLLN